MRSIKISSLPKMLFGHIYHSSKYNNTLVNEKGRIEVSYISKGEVTVFTDNESFTLGEGSVFCCLHNENTRVKASDFHCHHTVCARVDWEFSEEESALTLPYMIEVKNDTSKICHIIDNIIHNISDYETHMIKGSTKFLELLCEIDKSIEKEKEMSGEQIYVKKAKQYIEKNIHLPISQTEIAKALNISSGYLCAVFKSNEGISVKKYINITKLERIKTLMERENIHLYEATELFGYSDPNYVSRLYKSIFGYNITDKPKTLHHDI